MAQMRTAPSLLLSVMGRVSLWLGSKSEIGDKLIEIELIINVKNKPEFP